MAATVFDLRAPEFRCPIPEGVRPFVECGDDLGPLSGCEILGIHLLPDLGHDVEPEVTRPAGRHDVQRGQRARSRFEVV